MRTASVLFLVLIASGCGSHSTDVQPSNAPAPDSAKPGKAWLTLRGEMNETRRYGSPSQVNSLVYCIQHSGIRQSDLQFVTARPGTDVGNPSNWIESFSISFFNSREIPTGRVTVDSRSRDSRIEYRDTDRHGKSISFFAYERCHLNISKTGNDLSVDFDCPELKNDRARIQARGSIECSITQM